MKEANFKCNHCGHLFVFEDRLLRHRCKQMLRKEEMETPIGQAAWFHYQAWMRAQHHLIPHIKSFLHSKYYQPFIRFATFARQVRIPDPDLYITQMVALDMPPMLWTNDQVYVAFLEYMDKKVLATKNAQITIETLFDYAEALGCEIYDVFDHIDANECIQLIRQRKLSPWLLLKSDRFFTFLRKLSQDQKIVMETIIRPKYWAEKLKDNPETVEQMKKFVKELNL
jgi:hypothetical protein